MVTAWRWIAQFSRLTKSLLVLLDQDEGKSGASLTVEVYQPGARRDYPNFSICGVIFSFLPWVSTSTKKKRRRIFSLFLLSHHSQNSYSTMSGSPPVFDSRATTPENRRDSSDYKGTTSNAEKGDALGDKDVRVMHDGSGVGTTHRGLTSRHITFIGIGGGIGTVSFTFLYLILNLPKLVNPDSILALVGFIHWYWCSSSECWSSWSFAVSFPVVLTDFLFLRRLTQITSYSAYCFVGAILWCVMESIGELATLVSHFSQL